MTEEIDELTVANRINGTENDCILSIISAPKQEEFIAKNKNVLNSRVWLGLGSGGQLEWEKGKSGRSLPINVRHAQINSCNRL